MGSAHRPVGRASAEAQRWAEKQGLKEEANQAGEQEVVRVGVGE